MPPNALSRPRLPVLQRWLQLPREARDLLFQLAVIAWTLVPHAGHLPWWCTLLSAGVLLWRAEIALHGRPLPSRWLVAALLVLGAAATIVTEGTLLGKDAGVTMLAMLMCLKTLELRGKRDAQVVFFLGFFLMLTNFLYSQSLLVALSMLLSVWGMLTSLALAHMPVGRPSLRLAGGLALRGALLGAPLMVLLFVLFPRIGPLWGMPGDAIGRTGLSGTLRLGGVAEVANDDSIALRVRFLDAVPPPEAMYFRGPVLGSFNGREWTRLEPKLPPAYRLRAELQTQGAPVRYEMTLEPSRLPLLPLLEATPDREGAAPQLPGLQASLRADLQWQLDRPLTERLRFQTQAWPDHRHGPPTKVVGLRDWVDLPGGQNPRLMQWAADLRARTPGGDAQPRLLVDALLRHIREGGYFYTLEPGPYDENALDEFWFDRKLGFCEHYAAAFVVALRAMDVPARIVTGYQGTDPAPVDGYWIVRQRNAHAWAEYWAPGLGWQRVDPTAAVAPDRIQRGRSLAPRPGLVTGALVDMSPEMAERLRQAWETVNNRWNQWVLNYARGQQFQLLRALGLNADSWQDLATLLIGALSLLSLGGAAWAWWDRRRQDPWQRLQTRVQQRLASLGVAVAVQDSPAARAQQVRRRLGAAGDGLAQCLDDLQALRYAQAQAQAPGRAWWRRFAAAARRARAAAPGAQAGRPSPVAKP
ncbi:MAG: transglutaminaseTgpA domain-containing protein [Rubrivivax sp.]